MMTDKFYKDADGQIYAVNPLQNPDVGWLELSEGEIALLAQQALDAPLSVSRAQGKSALINRGLWPAILAYTESIEDDIQRALAEVALNDTTHWQRNSPFLNAAAVALGLSDEQLDELFVQASKIEL